MWEFMKNLVLNKLRIFTEWKKRQKLQILMEKSILILICVCDSQTQQEFWDRLFALHGQTKVEGIL